MNSLIDFIRHSSTKLRNVVNYCDLDINRNKSIMYLNNDDYSKLRLKLILVTYGNSDECSFECVLYEVTDKCIDVGVYETKDLDVFYVSNIGIDTKVASSSFNISKKLMMGYLLNKITANNVLLGSASKSYIQAIETLEDVLTRPSLKEFYVDPETRIMNDVK